MQSDLQYYPVPAYQPVIDVHENAFFFDEKENVIYLSFKNISRIIKVSYPDGKVLGAYGEIYKPGMPETGNNLFCDQHGVKVLKNGRLCMFNNNSCNEAKALPTVLILKEPRADKNSLEKIWEYECSLKGLDTTGQMRMLRMRQKSTQQEIQKRLEKNKDWKPVRALNSHVTSGGNVIEMPDQSLFVCMNSQFGKMFIINLDKKILWSAVTEKVRMPGKTWFSLPQQYRASIITRAQLEQLIWNSDSSKP